MFPGVTSRLSVASVELSEFVNGESFVGRELARRVVSASSAKEYGRCDDDDESLILLLLHKNFRMSRDALDKAISNRTWRKHLNKDLNY